MMIPRRCHAAFVFVLLSLIPVAATATQVQYLPLQTLGTESPLVVRASVREVRSFWNDAHTRILTETTVRVSESYKGAPAGELRIVQMGGEIDGVRMTVAGALSWRQGEDVVLFLEDSLPGRYRVAGFSQGKFEVQRDPQTGEEMVLQAPLGGVELVDAGSARVKHHTLRALLEQALPAIQGGE
ncbi:hypothetical protein DRQ53_11125 [bacterium]|nr:MAG: hypothetical protein DRQ53_11125 [bacterium]